MSTVRMRPTFFLDSPKAAEETMLCIKRAFVDSVETNPPTDSSNADYQGQFAGDHAMISIVESKRHFWSPWMHLEIRERESGRIVFGRFSPHPSIWTGFMFAYLAIAVIVFFATMFGISQQLSAQTPWAYYVIPGGGLLAIILWFAAKTGQNLAQQEMRQMKAKVEACLMRQDEN